MPTARRNTLEQEAHDVVTFLAWAANPEMVERKQIGVRVVLFLMLMTGLTYAREAQGLGGRRTDARR